MISDRMGMARVCSRQALATAVGDIANPGRNVANHNKAADWNDANGNVTTVGSAGGLSIFYWGTYDQGGNVAEWLDDPVSGDNRVTRGGSFESNHDKMRNLSSETEKPDEENANIGFRVAGLASIPYP